MQPVFLDVLLWALLGVILGGMLRALWNGAHKSFNSIVEGNMYDIEISYETGNSFHTYTETTSVGAITDNIEDAKENLQRVKAHYEQQDMPYEKGYKPLILKTTDGERTWEWPLWIGHFEHLLEAKVMLVDDNDPAALVYHP